MKCAVIGGSGQLGQEFARCVPADALVCVSHDQLDVGDEILVNRCIDSLDGDVIINLAAFHNVNQCEEDPAKTFRTNSVGAGLVANAGTRRGLRVVYFSSDYVFGLDADRTAPYLERDTIGPVNIYGVSKAAGEHLVRAATPEHLIVRTSSLFGVVTSRKGWTFPEMILNRAKRGEPLRVVGDQYMSPTYTADLVKAVLSLLERGATGTVHVTNNGGCTWYEFARATLDLAGVDHPVQEVTSDEFPSKARRPMYSRLDSERFEELEVRPLRHWRDALGAYLREKGVIG